MNFLDIEIFTCEMHELPRYRYIFAPQIYTYTYSLVLCINWLDIQIFPYNINELATYRDIRLQYE